MSTQYISSDFESRTTGSFTVDVANGSGQGSSNHDLRSGGRSISIVAIELPVAATDGDLAFSFNKINMMIKNYQGGFPDYLKGSLRVRAYRYLHRGETASVNELNNGTLPYTAASGSTGVDSDTWTYINEAGTPVYNAGLTLLGEASIAASSFETNQFQIKTLDFGQQINVESRRSTETYQYAYPWDLENPSTVAYRAYLILELRPLPDENDSLAGTYWEIPHSANVTDYNVNTFSRNAVGSSGFPNVGTDKTPVMQMILEAGVGGGAGEGSSPAVSSAVTVAFNPTEQSVGELLAPGKVVRNSVTGQKFLKVDGDELAFVAVELVPKAEWSWSADGEAAWEVLQGF